MQLTTSSLFGTLNYGRPIFGNFSTVFPYYKTINLVWVFTVVFKRQKMLLHETPMC